MACCEGDMVAAIVAIIAASQQVEAGDATVSFSDRVSKVLIGSFRSDGGTVMSIRRIVDIQGYCRRSNCRAVNCPASGAHRVIGSAGKLPRSLEKSGTGEVDNGQPRISVFRVRIILAMA